MDRPARAWEGRSARELADRWGAATVHLFQAVGSTNDVARRLAAGGAPPGTVVLAEEQLAGRGRVGRSWVSPAGLGLWVTVTGPARAPGDVGPLPLLVGLAAASALDEFLPPPGVGLKWPNDLCVGERKFGGILCETSWAGDRPGAVVAGVGLNLLHTAGSFPPEVGLRATSLRIEVGEDVSRRHVADRVVPAVLAALTGGGRIDAAAAEALARKDLLRGHRVAVSDPMTGRSLVEGRAEGIGADGWLLVRDDAGAVQAVTSGTVRRVSGAR